MATNEPSGRKRAAAASLVIALAACGVALIIGYNAKDLCTRHQWDGYQYRTLCYNDVFALYTFRGLQYQPFPYIHGDGIFDNEVRPDGSRGEVGDLEYPVLTGMLVGIVAEVTHNGVAFFHVTAVILAVLALLSVALLWPMLRDTRRIFYFAIAPSLVLYTFHNWDVFAVFLMCLGLWAFHRRSDGWAGTMLGLGAAAKVFPGLILPALVLARRRENGKVSWRMIGAAAGSFAVVNIPFAFIDRAGWWAPWKFQATRLPNFETSWFNLYRHLTSQLDSFVLTRNYQSFTSYASAGLFVAGALLLLWAEGRRAHFRPYATSFGILLIWLLTAKVYSPQYALWLLPFFALVEIPWWGFAGFAITDAAVWITVSWFFLSFKPPGVGNEATLAWYLEATVYARYAVLLVLLWLSRRANENVPDEPISSPERSAGVLAAPVEFST
ncbi:MAG TPA: glycosyltransferase 87 family protein [Actinomycetota bacterium]|nr:glycosyltransferase 87 family protein [Actinomycetota bacterium]